MNHVELGEQHNSMKELIQRYISSFGRGDRSMHHSICLRRNFGEKCAQVNNVLFDEDMHYFTMYMQAIAPRRSIIPYKLHGQLWAIKISIHGHSLGDQREILFHDGCIPKAPNISHTFSHSEMTWEACKWWGNHLPHIDLMQSGDAPRWFHMWDYDPHPYAQISVSIYVLLIP